MRFNQDPNKQALEVIFSRKLKKESHPSFNFNSNIVYQATSQKYFGIILGNPLHFEEHLKESKISRILGLLREFHWLISRFTVTVTLCMKKRIIRLFTKNIICPI